MKRCLYCRKKRKTKKGVCCVCRNGDKEEAKWHKKNIKNK